MGAWHVSTQGAVVRADVTGTLTPWEAATMARDLLAAAGQTGDGAFTPCKLCGDPVLWAETPAGAGIPLSLGADASGTVAMRAAGGRVLARPCKPGSELRPGEQRAQVHYGTCRARPARAGPEAERDLLRRLAADDDVLLGRLLAATDAWLVRTARKARGPMRRAPLPRAARR